MKTILLFLFLGAGFVYGSPEDEVQISERFLGSNESGDVYYSITSAYDNTGTYYANRSTETFNEHRKISDDQFVTSETVLSELYVYDPEAAGKEWRTNYTNSGRKIHLEDLLTSGTFVHFGMTADGLVAKFQNDVEKRIYTSDEMKRLFSLEWRDDSEFMRGWRCPGFFFGIVHARRPRSEEAGNYVRVYGNFVVPIPNERVLGPTTDTLAQKASRPEACATTGQTKR